MRNNSDNGIYWVLCFLGLLACMAFIWLVSQHVYDGCIEEGGTETECENRVLIILG